MQSLRYRFVTLLFTFACLLVLIAVSVPLHAADASYGIAETKNVMIAMRDQSRRLLSKARF